MPAHADIPTGSLNDDPASPYAPALPPELLDEILDYLQQTNWRARTFSTSHGPSRHLLAFRLVCKQWNIVSLPRVFSHLVVRDAVNRFEGFAIFLASPSISLPASHVQSLTMTSDISWSGGKPLLRSRVLREILSYLPYLEVLVLDSIRLGTSHSDSPPQPLFRYKARTLLRRCTLRLGRASPSVLRRVTSGNDDSQCRFTLKRLTLKQFSLRDGRAEQLMSALSIFSAIGRLEFMRIRDLRLPETAERAWRAGIEKTKAAPGPVVVQELIVDGTSNHLMVPTLKDTIDVQKIASMSVELPLVDNFFKMSAFLSSGSMTTGRAGVASNLLTDLTLDVSDVVLFADQAGTQDEHGEQLNITLVIPMSHRVHHASSCERSPQNALHGFERSHASPTSVQALFLPARLRIHMASYRATSIRLLYADRPRTHHAPLGGEPRGDGACRAPTGKGMSRPRGVKVGQRGIGPGGLSRSRNGRERG